PLPLTVLNHAGVEMRPAGMEPVQVFVQLSRARCGPCGDSGCVLPKLVIPTRALWERMTIRAFRAPRLPVTRADDDTDLLLAFERGLSDFLAPCGFRFGRRSPTRARPSPGFTRWFR